MPIDIQSDALTTALQKLQAREEAFLRLEEISKLGSWEVDLVTKQSTWSDQSFKIYGLDKETTQPNLELFFQCSYQKICKMHRSHCNKQCKQVKSLHFNAVSNVLMDKSFI